MSTSNPAALLSRRRFLGWSQAALALLARPAFATTENTSTTDDYYQKLGVEKIINAAGTYTYLTASVMPPEVQRAVAQAALHPVVLDDLQKASGEYIARLRCEGAVVTSGASGALTLATAACIAAANGCRPEQIPEEVASMKNEVIVQKAHRYEYDHAMLLCGIRIVEVVSVDDYKRAFTPKTIMTNFFNAAEAGEIDRQSWLDIAHQHNVPCHPDALPICLLSKTFGSTPAWVMISFAFPAAKEFVGRKTQDCYWGVSGSRIWRQPITTQLGKPWAEV